MIGEGGLGAIAASRSHAGHVRELNEDSVVVHPPVFAVADGMGGHEFGDKASRIVAEVIHAFARDGRHDVEGIRRALTLANARIRKEVGSRGSDSAGTTVVGVMLTPSGAIGFNVGDSRLYTFRSDWLEQVSTDHSAVQELIDAGEVTPGEASIHPDRHIITRAIGIDLDVEVDVWTFDAEVGDRLLVVSDGLTGEISDAQIEAALALREGADDTAQRLVSLALEAGGRDNVSVIVVDIVIDDDLNRAGSDTLRKERVSTGDTTEPRRRMLPGTNPNHLLHSGQIAAKQQDL